MHPIYLRWTAASAVTHLVVAGNGGAGLGCLVHDLAGIPCPGCGLTTATLQLLRGEWSDALAIHPFVPLFLFAAALFAGAAVLPHRPRENLAAWLDRQETHHGRAMGLTGAALLLHWIFRLIFP